MKVVNVSNGDYKLIVKQGGSITLDTNPGGYGRGSLAPGGTLGTVTITGNLEVLGDTTYVEVSDMHVEDNIITINNNGANPTTGLILSTLDSGTSGIRIYRPGSADTESATYGGYPSILFDENVYHLNDGQEKWGTFTFRNDQGLVGIQTCHINSGGGDLFLLVDPSTGVADTGVVTVFGTDNYERNVFDYADFELDPPTGPLEPTDPDALPNVQALVDYVDSTLAFFDDYAISEGDTSVECIEATPGPYNYYRTLLDPTYVGPANSKISFTVNGIERGQFNDLGLDVDNVNIFTNTIDNSTANLILTSTAANNIVEIDAVLQLNDTGLGPTAITGSTKIYTQDSDTTPAPGKTGIYFTSLGNSDELVSKNRAVLFSILL
jgi:hypothetical protein